MIDPEDQLRSWADRPVDVPDPAFADRLDAELRVLAAQRTDAVVARPLWQPVVLALGLLLVVASSIVFLARDRNAGEVDAVDPSPPTTAAVTTAVPSTSTSPPTTSAGSTSPDTLTAESAVTTAPSTIAAPSTTVPTTNAPTTAAPTTTSERPSTTDGRGPTTSPRPTDGVATTSTTVAAEVVLTVDPQRTTVVLTWSFTGPASVAGWEIVVTNGDRTSTVATLRDPAARRFTTSRLTSPVAYQVVARSAEGTVIAESSEVRVD